MKRVWRARLHALLDIALLSFLAIGIASVLFVLAWVLVGP
jgi:hypothetical protein